MILKILSAAREEIKEGYIGVTTRFNEGTTATLSISNGFLTDVLTADWWGRGNYCAGYTTVFGTCGSDWRTDEYGGTSVKAQVKALCIPASGKTTSCSFGVNTGNLGDPAWGRGKQLDLKMDFICNENYYKTSTGCTVCPGGQFSPGGGATSCSGCAVGKYRNTAGTACVSCAAGTYNASTGATSSSACLPCVAGTYSAAEASTCTACPAGQWSAAGATLCNLCPVGTYSGTPNGTSESVCTKCPAGRYSDTAGASSCKVCGPGTYSVGEGATSITSCLQCPAGQYSSGGKGNCDLCPPGKFSTAIGAVTSDTCQDCAANTYNPYSGRSSCEAVPAGFWSSAGASNYTAVEAGKYRLPGGTIMECRAGYSCATRDGEPTICPSGTYSPAGRTTCTPCPGGSYSVAGAADVGQCRTLTIGQYPSSASPDGFRCESGYVKNTSTKTCTECGIGFYSNKNITPEATTCQQCPTGTHSIRGSAACRANTEGQVIDYVLQEGFRCLSGYVKVIGDSDATSFCRKCPAGTFAKQGEISSLDPTQCTGCPIGKSSSPGAEDCTGCLPGQYYNRELRACVKTQDGYYSPGGLQEYQCPPGSYCPQINSTQGAGSAVSCPRGYYGATSGLTTSACTGLCPAGSYCGGSASDTGYSAPIGCNIDTTI